MGDMLFKLNSTHSMIDVPKFRAWPPLSSSTTQGNSHVYELLSDPVVDPELSESILELLKQPGRKYSNSTK